MKIISLAVAALVNNVLRQPIEGDLTVADKEAARLFDCGILEGEPEDVPDDTFAEVDKAEGDGSDAERAKLEAMTVPDLHILVTKEGVPLHDATKKAEIIDAIVKHRGTA